MVAAFDAAAMVRSLDRTVTELAAARHAAGPPARRALEAELADATEPLRVALVRLGELAPAARASDADAEWTVWVDQLRACFGIADALWPALDDALARLTPERDR